MRCTQCGKELIEGARFCGHCGAKQEPIQQAPKLKKQREKRPKKPVNKMVLIVWIISGVLLLAAIAMVFAFVVFPDGLHFGDNKTSSSYEREDRDERDEDDADDAEDTDSNDLETDPFDELVEADDEPVEAVDKPVEEPTVHMLPADAKIGVVLMAGNKTLEDVFISEVSDRGGEVIIIDSDGDAGKEAAAIESLIVQGVDAIILIPVGQIPEVSLQAAEDAGISVLISGYDEDGDYNMVTQDTTSLGEMVASYAGNNVVIISAMEGSSYFSSMETSTSNTLNDIGASLLGVYYSDFDPSEAMVVTENALVAQPEIDTVICFDPISPSAVCQTLNAIGFDGTFIGFTTGSNSGDMSLLANDYDTVLMYFSQEDMATALVDTAVNMFVGVEVEQVTYFEPSAQTNF